MTRTLLNMGDAEKLALVLGIDPMRIEADSITLEPFGDSWVVRWRGFAILDATAARIYFGGADE